MASFAQSSSAINGTNMLSTEVISGFHYLDSKAKKKLLHEVREVAKKNFEVDRDAVLATLPNSYKSMFNKIGFAKFGQSYHPVLILSPYCVPPNEIRRNWLTIFECVSTKLIP